MKVYIVMLHIGGLSSQCRGVYYYRKHALEKIETLKDCFLDKEKYNYSFELIEDFLYDVD